MEEQKTNRLVYCPQPWRFLCLPALKEELESRGLNTVGARKTLELRITQYEERVKKMGDEGTVDTGKVPPILLKGPLIYEYRLSLSLRHLSIKPFREELLDVAGMQAWLSEAAGYAIKRTKSGESLAVLKFDTIEKGDAAYFDLKEKLQEVGVSVSHPEFQPRSYSKQFKASEDPILELLGEEKQKDSLFTRLIILENVPPDLCTDEKLAAIFPEAQSCVGFNQHYDSRGLAVLEMLSEDSVKTLLGNEETVQIEVEGHKIYATRYNTRFKVWDYAVRINKKICKKEKPALLSGLRGGEGEDWDDGGDRHRFNKNVILSDDKRLEMTRKLHELNKVMAGLSNTTEIFGMEKIDMHKKLNNESAGLYKDIIEDAKRRLNIGESLPEPLELIPEQMQNYLGYNNAPFRQLESLDMKYKKALADFNEAKLNMGNLWQQVMENEKKLQGPELAEYQRRKKSIQRYDEKTNLETLHSKNNKQEAKPGPGEESDGPEDMDLDEGEETTEQKISTLNTAGGNVNVAEQPNRNQSHPGETADGNDWGKSLKTMFGAETKGTTPNAAPPGPNKWLDEYYKTRPQGPGTDQKPGHPQKVVKQETGSAPSDRQVQQQKLLNQKFLQERQKKQVTGSQKKPGEVGKSASSTRETSKKGDSEDSKSSSALKGKGTALVPYDVDDQSGDENSGSDSERSRRRRRSRSRGRRSRSRGRRSRSKGRRSRSRSRGHSLILNRRRYPNVLGRNRVTDFRNRPKILDFRKHKPDGRQRELEDRRREREKRHGARERKEKEEIGEKDAETLISRAIDMNDWLDVKGKKTETQADKKSKVDYIIAQKVVPKQEAVTVAARAKQSQAVANTRPTGTLADLTRVTEEKSPINLINDLSSYHKINYQFTLVNEMGPAHKKVFYISLKLGDEEYSASGPTLKKAQHTASELALVHTRFKLPASKQPDNHPPTSLQNPHVVQAAQMSGQPMSVAQQLPGMMAPMQRPPVMSAHQQQIPGMMPAIQGAPVMSAHQQIPGMMAPVMSSQQQQQQIPGMMTAVQRQPVMSSQQQQQQIPGQFAVSGSNQPVMRQAPTVQAGHIATQVSMNRPPPQIPQAGHIATQVPMNRPPPMPQGALPLTSHMSSQVPIQRPPSFPVSAGQVSASQMYSQSVTERPPQIPGQLLAPSRSSVEPKAAQPTAPQNVASNAALTKLNAIEAVLNEKMRRLQELQKSSMPGQLSMVSAADKPTHNPGIMATGTRLLPGDNPSIMATGTRLLPGDNPTNPRLMAAASAAGLGYQSLPDSNRPYI